MEKEKSGSVFTSVLVVVILLGLVVFYLTREKDVQTTQTDQSETSIQITEETSEENQMMTETEADAELEAEIESLDTSFEDMNAEDLDM